MLLMQLSPYVLASYVATFCNRKAFSKKMKKKSGKMLAAGLLQLGPLYIKIGQILSCRENLLPVEWVKALERLQDRVPAKSGEDARELACSAFGSKEKMEQILEDFDDVPLAAASLGQVHIATLRPNVASRYRRKSSSDNNKDAEPEKVKVAIKVQRARLRDIYDKDLALLKKVAKMGDKISLDVGGARQSWTDIIKE